MIDFAYRAIDVAGREKHGRIAAPSLSDARETLKRKQLYIVSIDQGDGISDRRQPLVSGMRFGQKRASAKQLTLFTRQLATLSLVSPLEEALRTIALQTEKPHMRKIVSNVHAGVFEGRRIADAMASEKDSFPALYRALVSAGEASGTLPIMLERLAHLLERQAAMRSKIVSALAYPIILACVALLVVGALMIWVVPKIVEQFDTVGQVLPLITRIVMALSAFLAGWWWALLIMLAIGAFVAWQLLKNNAIRLRFDAWLLRLPLFGRLLRDLNAARMARTLATMVASRLPLYEGLSLTTPTISNHALRAASQGIVEEIRGGGSLSGAMKTADIFPPLLVYLVASGEASGQLDMMLERAADYLEQEFDTFTTTALAMLEPLIIVVMGSVVAAIILSILLPILQLESMAAL
jgi:general secretion pathway protein F